jgi:hypothetical protein
VRQLLAQAGIDRPVLYGGLSKVSLAVFNLLIILAIAWRLPPELQGYYYTYLNLTALQVFAELGLGVVIVQVCSHLWASLRLDESGAIRGESDALSRLVSLGRLSVKWYGAAGIVATVVIAGAGTLFFLHSPSVSNVPWQGSWLLLCVLTGMKMWLVPVWSLLEGCNQTASLYRFRFLNSVVGGSLTVGALLLGLGLWSPSVGIAGELLFGGVYLSVGHGPFLRSFAAAAAGPRTDWKRDIFPLQWRIAGSWMAGYFATALFTPVLFHFQGARAAGQWGMTWSMFAMVTSISMLWVSTKGPQFGVWIARREFDALDREFFRATRASVAVAVLGVVCVWGGLWGLHRLNHPLADRVLSPLPAGCLALSVVLMSIPVAQSVYLRAHLKEPLVLASVVQAALIAVIVVIARRSSGALGIAAGYLAVVALVASPWSCLVWMRCRAQWHAVDGS